jgi:hypothetical protein
MAAERAYVPVMPPPSGLMTAGYKEHLETALGRIF